MHEVQMKMFRADRPARLELPEQERDAGLTDTGRLAGLCDGVFAIIITFRPGDPSPKRRARLAGARTLKGMAVLYRVQC
jgi:hypothetical protein